MTEETNPAPVVTDRSGQHVARIALTPKPDTKKVHVVAPPDVVIPVVFIPGIMGSNLRNKKSGESVWNINSTGSLARQWMLSGASSRQKKLVPAEVEVNNGGEFPGASSTVPDAATAKARGWGTVSKAFYGEILVYLDDMMNDNSPPHWSMLTGLCEDTSWAREWGAEKPYEPLHGTEANYAFNFYCPVHAIGYNWLQDNRQSGIDVVKGVGSGSNKIVHGIDDIIDLYASQKRDDGSPRYRCTQVILVTHSMGGLVARAAINPQIGNAQSKVLGIIHGEQPANGAAAAYHHARAGNDGMASLVLGWSAAQVTATFANSPGALELLPNQQYSPGWLKAVSPSNNALLSKPKSDPYLEIYQFRDLWYRVVDPSLVDPAGLHAAAGVDPWIAYIQNLRLAREFHYTLKTTYHPVTYAHYGADSEQLAFGNIVWSSTQSLKIDPADVEKATLPAGANSNPASLDGKNWFGWSVPMDFTIAPAEEAGDATVPKRSGEAPGRAGVKQSFRMIGFEHSAAYKNIDVQLATLYSIAKILNLAKLN